MFKSHRPNPYDLLELFASAASGEERKLSALLAKGTPPDPIDAKGDTPAMICASLGRHACLDILLRSGSLPNARNPRTGYTCAMHAASNKHAGCLRALAAFGADFQAMTPAGQSAAEFATRADHLESLRIILGSGFDLETKHRHRGLTLAHIAATEGSPSALAHLIEQGARIEALDLEGLTPAGIAYHAGQAACLAILLRAGCRSDIAETPPPNPCRFLASQESLHACQELLLAEIERRELARAAPIGSDGRSALRI